MPGASRCSGQAVNGSNPRVRPVTWDRTLEQALCRVAGKDGQPALAHEGDVVLLAPACSSYDQYPNYLRRGEDFKRVVHEVLA